MYDFYFEIMRDFENFCNKADEFIKRQKEIMEGKDDGKTLTKVQKSGNY